VWTVESTQEDRVHSYHDLDKVDNRQPSAHQKSIHLSTELSSEFLFGGSLTVTYCVD
jgi:hypothetical protein